MKGNRRTNNQGRKLGVLLVCALLTLAVPNAWAQEQVAPQRLQLKTYHPKPPADLNIEQIKTDLKTNGFSPAIPLPLWTYTVTSSRDGNQYSGVMVGASPFDSNGNKNVSIPGYIVPLIIVTNSVAVANHHGLITTAPGMTTFDPTQATNCLSAPNNVPSTLIAQSPLFQAVDFVFGGVDVGTTQYVDAFQRSNFWVALGENGIRDTYHVALSPVETLQPVMVNVPADRGLSVNNGFFFGPPAFCAPFGMIDFGWLDAYLQSTVIPALHAQGVGPGNLPMFLLSNVVEAGQYNNRGTCCTLGYHNITGPSGVLFQTYLVSEFDSSLIWRSLSFHGPAIHDSAIWSHEIGEWMNDPTQGNPVPAWGHIGQQSGCQGNLEVGDPLTGTPMPAVTMSNGYTYHLQELADFSWFLGNDPLGVNGWYSDNGTLLTNAGPVCQ